MKNLSKLFTLLLISTFGLFSCSDDYGVSSNKPMNIVEVASENGNFSTLVNALATANLAVTLEGDGPFTVFAPTNAAFDNLPSGLLQSLSNEQLATILSYHVLSGSVASTDLQAEQAVSALTEENVFVTVENNTVSVNGRSTVVAADVTASNGIIHGINEVLFPNEFINIVKIVSKNYDLSTLVTLLADNNLVATLEGDGPFTVFAPTNQAFDNAQSVIATLSDQQVADVLLYHVAAGEALSGSLSDGQTVTTQQGEDISINIDGAGNVTLNGSVNVTTVDLDGTNGVVHIIDGVLLPPSFQN